MEDVAATVQTKEKPSRETAIKAAIEKGKAAAAPEEPKSNGNGRSAEGQAKDPAIDPVPGIDQKGAPANGGAEGGDIAPEAGASTSEGGDGSADKDAKPEPPKNARAKEWADIKRVKADLAVRERAAARKEAEANKLAADIAKAQQEIQELNRLYHQSPKQFVERLSGRPGGLRELFIAATEEEKRTPEEERALAAEARVAALEAKLAKWEGETEEARKRREADEARRQEVEAYNGHLKHTQAFVEMAVVDEGGYPNIAKSYPSKHSRAALAERVLGTILTEWNGGRGREVAIPAVLDVIEKELTEEAGSVPEKVAPPARAAGAEPTAKPEAKRAPKTLTNTAASARASAPKDLKGRDRLEFFAKQVRRI